METINSKYRFSNQGRQAAVFFALANGLSCYGLSAAPDIPMPAAASSESPMRVVVVRSAETECEPKCAEWISAEGKLNPETVAEFQKIINATRRYRLPVLIHSHGGSVGAGLAIGRMIRSRQLDVAVSKTDFKPCDATARDCPSGLPIGVVRGLPRSRGAICASSCTFILAAGFHRFVAPWAAVGVHQITEFQRQPKQPLLFEASKSAPPHEAELQKQTAGEKHPPQLIPLDEPTPQTDLRIIGYFRQMGISDQLHRLMVATEPKDVHWLSHAELDSTHMATDYYGGETLVAQSSFSPPSGANTDAVDVLQIARRIPDFKMDVASLGYGIVKMSSFANRDVTVSLEFLHRKDLPTVEMSAVVEERDGIIPTGNLVLDMQFGARKQSTVIEATSVSSIAPLVATIPSSDICGDMLFSNVINLTLVQSASGSKNSGPPKHFDMQNWPSMRDFLADICKK
jgi:hypothetical protein